MKTNTQRQVLATGFLLAITLALFTPLARGQIFVVNENDNTIRQFTTAGVGSIFVPASAGFLPYNGGITFHSSGDLYVVNNGNHTIDKVAPNGTRSFFGSLYPVSVSGITFDNTGTNLYVSSYGNGNILMFTPDGTRSTFATGVNNAPIGLAFDSAGDLYAACQDSTIRKFDNSGHNTIFADSAAGLNGASGLAYGGGFFYVANFNDHTIRKIDSSGNGTIFAGVAGDSSHGLNYPFGLAFDGTGNLYVSNQGDHTIWKFDSNGTGSVFVPPGTLVGPGFIAIRPGCAPAIMTLALYAGVNIQGTIGCTYRIDYATNLNDPIWIPLITNTLTSSPFSYVDTNVASGSRFYRTVAP